MSSTVAASGSGSGSKGKPKESRRWLKRRVPREHLYRLTPRPQPERLGRSDAWYVARHLLRAWWLWMAVAIAGYSAGHIGVAIPAAIAAFVFYQTTPVRHPAAFALTSSLTVDSAEFATTVAGMTATALVDGNAVAIFNDGDAIYPPMLEAIAAAQQSITMEQYILWDGEVGRRFAEVLAERGAAGVAVKIILDAVGSSTVGTEILHTLERGGCQLAWFQPIRWYTLDRANHRDHRKSLIVDGRVAFTGGAGMADHWVIGTPGSPPWRDVQIRVEGPAALDQQSGFAYNWLNLTGEILGGREFFPLPVRAGDVGVQVIQSSPGLGPSAAGTVHLLAIQCARRSVSIANSYFIPDDRMIDVLARACRRGVTVTLMLAGRHNDTWWARQNSVRLYGSLIKAGVQIYEYTPTMLHQKIMIVDDAWATVGTTNFDNRSFALNDETNVCFTDRALVRELRETFDLDLTRCEPITMQTWRERGLVQRTTELFASIIEDQL